MDLFDPQHHKMINNKFKRQKSKGFQNIVYLKAKTLVKRGAMGRTACQQICRPPPGGDSMSTEFTGVGASFDAGGFSPLHSNQTRPSNLSYMTSYNIHFER